METASARREDRNGGPKGRRTPVGAGVAASFGHLKAEECHRSTDSTHSNARGVTQTVGRTLETPRSKVGDAVTAGLLARESGPFARPSRSLKLTSGAWWASARRVQLRGQPRLARCRLLRRPSAPCSLFIPLGEPSDWNATVQQTRVQAGSWSLLH